MMHGEFRESSQIIVLLTLRGEDDREEQVEVVVDTGFTGFLVLPSRIIRDLGLVQLDINEIVLANGSIVRMAVYEVLITWHEEERAVLAYAGEGDALLGMSLLRGSFGSFEFFSGGLATIEAVE